MDGIECMTKEHLMQATIACVNSFPSFLLLALVWTQTFLCFLLCVVVVIIILGVVYTVLTKPNKYPPETTLLFILYIVLYVLKLAMNSMMDTFSLSNVHLRWWNTTFHFPHSTRPRQVCLNDSAFCVMKRCLFLKNYFYSIVNSQDNSASLENPL